MREMWRGMTLVFAGALLLVGCDDKAPTSPPITGIEGASAQAVSSPARGSPPRSLAPRQSVADGLIGTWGGDDVRITIGAASSILQYDCAHGTIDQPFAVNTIGRYDLVGTHTLEEPGPIREGQTPVARPARYTGSTDGKTMTFAITLTESNQTFGPFTLALDAPGRVVKCL
jgi:hypothetical protein